MTTDDAVPTVVNVATDRPPRSLKLAVSGFKAVRDVAEITVRPLTLIAGSNSSGKSSFMQPFLLMKQAIESDFDPGPLLLYGPNAKFTSHTQLFSRGKSRSDTSSQFTARIETASSMREVTFKATPAKGIRIDSSLVRDETFDRAVRLRETLRPAAIDELRQAMASSRRSVVFQTLTHLAGQNDAWEPVVTRNRCFLEVQAQINARGEGERAYYRIPMLDSTDFVGLLRRVIHVPGLRGNPERAYPRSAVGTSFPGTFEKYVASIVHLWAQEYPELQQRLADDLHELGLTWKVVAKRLDDASVELLVGRMPHAQQGGAQDLVSVADVGFGVSQILPVVVSLLVARPGQLVYLEQPEIHLHPKAQVALARCLVRAANRGVFVVAETHSSLILRAIQTEVAGGGLDPQSTSMNWFGRDSKSGVTHITCAELGPDGAFGDWPVDFDDIAQSTDWAYLDAVAARALG